MRLEHVTWQNERAGKRLRRLPARIAWGRPFPNQSCGSLQSPSGGSLSARDNSNKISNGRVAVNQELSAMSPDGRHEADGDLVK